MDTNQYAALAGIVLSLLFAYTPKLKDWYEIQPPANKQLVMLGLIFVIIAARLGLGCLGKDAAFPCTQDGIWQALQAFVVAIIANQGTYGATKYLNKTAAG